MSFDSICPGVLVAAHERLSADVRALVPRGAGPEVLRTLSVTRLDRCPTLQD